MLVTCSDVGKFFGGQRIFQHVNATIEPGERIALIGPNGAGKTTLLDLIAGLSSPDEGEVVRKPQLRVGYLRQNGGLSRDGTIESEMKNALQRTYDIEKALLEAGREMASLADHTGGEYRALEERYQSIEAEFAACDGYRAAVKISTVLTGMGFGAFDRQTKVSTLSGGEQTRLMLCKLLLEEPELLILDEATNHLDFAMLSWLEEYLSGFHGAILTVSHDRYFLERVTAVTWELEDFAVVRYPAPYSRYLALRAERVSRLEKEHVRHEQEIARLADYAERNMARASTAAGAKSRLKMIERLGEAKRPPGLQRPPLIRFTPKLRPVSDILRVEDLSVSVGQGAQQNTLLEHFDLLVKRGERIAVIGENGAGKSTLLKTLVGRLPCLRGNIEWGRNTKVSFFEQDAFELHPDKTALMELWDRFPTSNENTLRSLLGGLGLTGEQVFKAVGVLSGGERARIKLALLMLEQGNVLVLDEPTNHLDIPSKEALEEALLAFEGTLVVVSHDRWLLSRLPTRIVRLEHQTAESFEGGFENMLSEIKAREQGKPSSMPDETPAGQEEYHRSRARRSAQAAARRRLLALEQEIALCESNLSEAREQMARPDSAANYALLTALAEQAAGLQERLDALYKEWDELL